MDVGILQNNNNKMSNLSGC